MHITVLKKVSIEVSSVRCVVAVRYEEDDMPNDFPGRKGKQWSVIINLHNGELSLVDRTPFPKDAKLDLHMKVCDCGVYTLLDHCGDEVGEVDGYVPGFFPGQHYGDYLILEIADGKVQNWTKPSERKVAEVFTEQD